MIRIPDLGSVRIGPFGQWIWDERGRPDVLPSLKERIIDTGIIGVGSQNTATYLKSPDVPSDAPCGGYNLLSLNLHLHVNVKKLFELRNIFYDPETLTSGPEEYKKTFVIFGGIPNQTIVRFKLENIVSELEV